jgi:hypothetical protein
MTDPQSKSIGEQSYEQFAHQYAARADTKAHNAYYERPATLSGCSIAARRLSPWR